jgi:uncharacterized membrane protein
MPRKISNPFKSLATRMQGWFLTGVLTLIPVWITWVIFTFILEQLSALGRPAARKVTEYLGPLAGWFAGDAMQTVLALALTVSFILAIGWATTQFIGARLLALFDKIIQWIPLVEKIYGASKKLLVAMQQKPDGVQRIVLISFPHDEMKAIGIVTRTLTDAHTGEKIAAVYVPTTPVPTSGYLELVPLDQIISTDWTLDEAMTFIISGGAVARDTVNFRRSTGTPITLAEALGQADSKD